MILRNYNDVAVETLVEATYSMLYTNSQEVLAPMHGQTSI